MQKSILVDVYFVDKNPGVACPPYASLKKSWDESLYAETNVLTAAGQDKRLVSRGPKETANLAGFELCHSLTF